MKSLNIFYKLLYNKINKTMCTPLYKIAKVNRAETMPRRCAKKMVPTASDLSDFGPL